MVSLGMSGKPTLYGLLALSAMEIVASQKSGSPLAILQQPTKGFSTTAIAVSAQPSSPKPVGSPSLASATIPITDQNPSFTDPKLSPTTATPSADVSASVVQANQVAQTTSFRDLQSHWAQPFVELLAARGIISGYTDGTFQPDRDIQAAHFGMMLHQAKLHRLETLQRELDLAANSKAPQSTTLINRNRKSGEIASVTEAEAADLLRTHDIRTRAQAAVFIYRNFQAPMVSHTSATETLTVQPAQVSYVKPQAEPTFSDTEESTGAPTLSATFQWSPIDPTRIAQG